jgi:hypothetical protein
MVGGWALWLDVPVMERIGLMTKSRAQAAVRARRAESCSLLRLWWSISEGAQREGATCTFVT